MSDSSPGSELFSDPAASYCADALGAVGFQAAAHTNDQASRAASRSADDRVFYATGHSGSDCPGEWQDNRLADRNEATGASIVMLGDSGFLAGPRNLGRGSDDNCFPKRSGVVTAWATPSEIGRANLVVLQACLTLKPTFTATDGRQLVSIGQEAFDAGAGIVVGFKDEIEFQGTYGQFGTQLGIDSNYRPYGDMWAHTFWATLQSGATVYEAAEAATIEVNRFTPGSGYNSVVVLARPEAPDTLAGIYGVGP